MNFFWCSVSYETKHEKSWKNSGQNSGQNPGRKFKKFGELSFCNFSDLKIRTNPGLSQRRPARKLFVDVPFSLPEILKVSRGPSRTVFCMESDSVVFHYSVVNMLRVVMVCESSIR